MRQRGRFGPSASACMQAALSRLPCVECKKTAPLSAATSNPREMLDMVDAEAFLLCFYEEYFAIMKVLHNLQRQTLRSHSYSANDFEDTESERTPPCLNNGSCDVDSHQSGRRKWNLESEDREAARSPSFSVHKELTPTILTRDLWLEVSHFFHVLMDSDSIRAGTVSLSDFQGRAHRLHQEPSCLPPANYTPSSDDISLFVEAVKSRYLCGINGKMINYVRLWSTALSYLEKAQGKNHGPGRDGNYEAF